MDSDAFPSNFFKWVDPRTGLQQPNRLMEPMPPQSFQPQSQPQYGMRRDLGGLEEIFEPYGVRYYTAAKIAEMGFTVNTLLNMRDEELDEMMNTLCQIFRWEILFGERYGIKVAVRAERRRIIGEEDIRRRHLISGDTTYGAFDGLSQEEERMHQQEKEGGVWEMMTSGGGKKAKRGTKSSKGRARIVSMEEDDEEDDENEGGEDGAGERQREHPFIVTDPGEVARGKKNGLDYLFHLYEQCREFLFQVQNTARERGDKCPTKVTNEVFRYAKKSGATYINKPKMRHYVHCYALHCLDEQLSNAMRMAYKQRGENIGTWRLACYRPLVAMAASRDYDIDAIFSAHPRLSIWYVPTKLRQMCHAERSNAAAAASSSITGCGGGFTDQLLF